MLSTLTLSDGYTTYVRHWEAVGSARGHLIAVHGVQSHGGWYGRSSQALADAGYRVHFAERRGSGLNTNRRGDAPSFRRLLDDVADLIRSLPEDGLPRFLVGISWGGKLATGLQYRHPGLVEGLVLLCPGLFARVSPPLKQRIRIAGCKFRAPTKLFSVPLNDPALFTASPQWQEWIRRDRYGLRLATARFLSESFLLDIYLKRAKKHIRTPVLLMLGGNDRVVDNTRIRAYLAGSASPDVLVEEYADAAHTLEFEPPEHPWLGDLRKWLDAQTARHPSTAGTH